jgi:hypothetical protein
MSKTTSASNTFLDSLTGYLAAFTDIPNPSTGSGTEVSGGGYARVNLSGKLGTAAGESRASSATISFPPSTGSQGTVEALGIMSASTGGSMSRSMPLVSVWKPFAAGSAADTFTSYGHGFANATVVVVMGRDLPGGTNEYTKYYIINSTTDTFQISASSGGSAIDLSSNGGGYVGALSPKPITASGVTLTIDTGQLTLNEA